MRHSQTYICTQVLTLNLLLERKNLGHLKFLEVGFHFNHLQRKKKKKRRNYHAPWPQQRLLLDGISSPFPPKMECSQGNTTRSVSTALQQLYKDASALLGHQWGPSLGFTRSRNKSKHRAPSKRVVQSVCHTLTIDSLPRCCLHEDATWRKGSNGRAGCCAAQHL